jgi:hypothetical protein
MMFNKIEDVANSPTVLVVNDKFAARRGRLRKVLREFLPHDMLCEASELLGTGRGIGKIELGLLGSHSALDSEIVAVSGFASALAWPAHSFDRILLDAPCSNERHAVRSGGKSKSRGAAKSKQKRKNDCKSDIWSVSRVKREAAQQLSLLSSAMHALRPGGRLVYSTCSIDPSENDQVIEKLLARERGNTSGKSASAKLRKRSKHGKGKTSSSSSTDDGAQFPPPFHICDPLSELKRTGASTANAQNLQVLLGGVQRTLYGAVMLPDASHFGFGPLYWAVLEKRAQQPSTST